jgi:hypothetical protein
MMTPLMTVDLAEPAVVTVCVVAELAIAVVMASVALVWLLAGADGLDHPDRGGGDAGGGPVVCDPMYGAEKIYTQKDPL